MENNEKDFSLYAWLYIGKTNIGARYINTKLDYIDVTYEQIAVITNHSVESVKNTFKNPFPAIVQFTLHGCFPFGNYTFQYKKNTNKKIGTIHLDENDYLTDSSLNIVYGLFTYGFVGVEHKKDLLQYSSAALYNTGLFEALNCVASEITSVEESVKFNLYSLRDSAYLKKNARNIVDNILGKRFNISNAYGKIVSCQFSDASSGGTIISLYFFDALLLYKDRLSLIEIESQYCDNFMKRIYYTKAGFVEEALNPAYKFDTGTAHRKSSKNDRLEIPNDCCQKVSCQVIVNSNKAIDSFVFGAWLKAYGFANPKISSFADMILDYISGKIKFDIVDSNDITFIKYRRNKIIAYREYFMVDDGLASDFFEAYSAIKSICKSGLSELTSFVYEKINHDLGPIQDLSLMENIKFSVKKVNDKICIYMKMDKIKDINIGLDVLCNKLALAVR